jgi:hypothetical protein
VSMVSIPQKINFVKFILQKNLIFAKIQPTIAFFSAKTESVLRFPSQPTLFLS